MKLLKLEKIEKILDSVIKKEYKNIPLDVRTDFEKGMKCPARSTCIIAMVNLNIEL